ncbi:MAG: tetratricopeptide repeat protein [Planctomycetaceae bacterium]|nr:tetratricopeptide repeat protein [Planctomycetaceae bacterium]
MFAPPVPSTVSAEILDGLFGAVSEAGSDFDDTAEDFRRRLAETPNSATWGQAGIFFASRECFSQAEFCLRRAVELAPDSPQWWYLLGIISEGHSPDNAIASFRTAVSFPNPQPAMLLRFARLLTRVGHFEEAARTLQQALLISDAHPAVRLECIRLNVLCGDDFAAAAAVTDLVLDHRTGRDMVPEINRITTELKQRLPELQFPGFSVKPAFATQPLRDPWVQQLAVTAPKAAALSEKAASLAVHGRFQEAVRIYDTLIGLDGRNSRPKLYRAMVLMNAGDAAAAFEEVSAICREFPGDAMAFSCRGAVEMRMGRVEAAVQSFETAVQLKPDFRDAHRALMLTYEQLGRSADARKERLILDELGNSSGEAFQSVPTRELR